MVKSFLRSFWQRHCPTQESCTTCRTRRRATRRPRPSTAPVDVPPVEEPIKTVYVLRAHQNSYADFRRAPSDGNDSESDFSSARGGAPDDQTVYPWRLALQERHRRASEAASGAPQEGQQAQGSQRQGAVELPGGTLLVDVSSDDDYIDIAPEQPRINNAGDILPVTRYCRCPTCRRVRLGLCR